MPRIAMAAPAQDDEASSTRVDDLIQRGRSQGHLSLSDLRTAFEHAGLTPAEARSILRELSEAGVRLANEETETKGSGLQATASKSAVVKTAAKPAAKKATTRSKKVSSGDSEAAAAPETADADGDAEFGDDEVASIEADVAAFADGVDLDDQTPAMGDSVHTYLKSIGRTSLLTAEQEVDLANSPSTSWTPSRTSRPSSATILSLSPRTDGARRRTCWRPTSGLSCRSPRSTATGGCRCLMSCRKGTWA
jgi:RNA polymerase primary sigma factor